MSGSRETAATLPWHSLRYEQTQAIRAALVARYAPNTVNRMLTALRGVLKECWRLGTIEGDAYLRAADVASVKSHDEEDPAGHALTRAELAGLLAAIGAPRFRTGFARDGRQERRDRALILVMALGGLRVEEATSIPWSAWKDGALTVRGKGRRLRVVPLPSAASDALEAWQNAADIIPEGHVNAGATRIFPLIPRAVAYRLEALSDAAGIPHVSPHDLRRTYITTLLEAGVDVLLVAKLAGHASPATTKRYDRRELEAKRAAIAKLENFLA